MVKIMCPICEEIESVYFLDTVNYEDIFCCAECGQDFNISEARWVQE